MIRRAAPVGLALFVAGACAGAPRGEPRGPAPIADAALEALLVRQAQELVDAVTRGDPAVWERYLDPDALYVAEDGTRQTKASMVAQIAPLPEGVSGRITVTAPTLRRHGDTAILSYDLHEEVDYHGHPLDVTYRQTDTWQRASEGWRLIAAQVHAALADPQAITLPPDRLEAYTGVYSLAPDITYTIRRQGDGLVGQRTGRPEEPLSIEAPDVLFVPGQLRIRKVFQRDAAGHVTGFVDRREARDVPWTRAP